MNIVTRLINKIKHKLSSEHRRFPRYEIRETDKIQAFFSLKGARAYLHDHPETPKKPHPVMNLSKGGVALFLLEGENPEDFMNLPAIDLILDVEEQHIILRCQVVYVLEGIRCIGLKFMQVSEQQLEALSKFLDVRFLASSLKEISLKKQMIDKQECRWFHGQNNTDLFSWQGMDGKLLQYLFIFVNNVVEWTSKSGFRTGVVKRPDYAIARTTLSSKEPNSISYDQATDSKKVEAAREIINLANIDYKLKQLIKSELI